MFCLDSQTSPPFFFFFERYPRQCRCVCTRRSDQGGSPTAVIFLVAVHFTVSAPTVLDRIDFRFFLGDVRTTLDAPALGAIQRWRNASVELSHSNEITMNMWSCALLVTHELAPSELCHASSSTSVSLNESLRQPLVFSQMKLVQILCVKSSANSLLRHPKCVVGVAATKRWLNCCWRAGRWRQGDCWSGLAMRQQIYTLRQVGLQG